MYDCWRTDEGPPRRSGVLKVVATDEQRPCGIGDERTVSGDRANVRTIMLNAKLICVVWRSS